MLTRSIAQTAVITPGSSNDMHGHGMTFHRER
jgi:hypothetical protein